MKRCKAFGKIVIISRESVPFLTNKSKFRKDVQDCIYFPTESFIFYISLETAYWQSKF